jgi:hypothetical protein
MRTSEREMANHPAWTSGLGFRQLIEDGLIILAGRPIDRDRRKYVLEDLADLVLHAKRGSDLVRNHALFVASADRNAYDSFSLLDRFLDQAESEYWKGILEQSEQALNELQANKPLRDQQREAAVGLLQRILSGLIREPKPGIPNQPEELRIDG